MNSQIVQTYDDLIEYDALGLTDMDEIKYHNILDQIILSIFIMDKW